MVQSQPGKIVPGKIVPETLSQNNLHTHKKKRLVEWLKV
jgi:hypothetical protein